MDFRPAQREDIPLILHLIRSIAEYERLLDQVEATEELLDKWLFQEKVANVLFCVVDGVEVGYVLYFYNFSTFKGRPGLYLEDLYVFPEYRGNGYGKALFLELTRIAHEKGCGRMEWVCLDWNQPSIDFYLNLGAEPLDEWTTYRLGQDDLERLSTAE